jgi:2-polyprenyl-3-methyl-5-hydroxy-6-metoxy-1,4-benzoquinol methylase
MVNKLTEKNYWDSNYTSRKEVTPVSLVGYRNYCASKIYEKKEPFLKTSETILEIGGGGSSWLLYLAEKFPEKKFAALDYSEEGCGILRDALVAQGLKNFDIWEEDFFSPSERVGKFDLVYSHGVVEHFNDLSGVLRAHAQFISASGVMLTVIPNMAGVLGVLTKKMNRSVYDIHVPHDLQAFVKGHYDAGLEVIDSGYLCSNNFGVLSSCVSDKNDLKKILYKALSRLSKAVWFVESRYFNLPAIKLFSPYIYVISKKTVQ